MLHDEVAIAFYYDEPHCTTTLYVVLYTRYCVVLRLLEPLVHYLHIMVTIGVFAGGQLYNRCSAALYRLLCCIACAAQRPAVLYVRRYTALLYCVQLVMHLQQLLKETGVCVGTPRCSPRLHKTREKS